MIKFDRGKYIRTLEEYKKIMNNIDHLVIDDFYKMSFQNIFHYKNFDLKELYQKWKKEVS